MTKDDIIKMAVEVAAQHGHTIKPTDEIVETLTSFYHLVAAHEREAILDLAEYFARENVGLRDAIRQRSQS